MNTQSIPAVIMAGICVYVGTYHLIVFLRRPQSRQNFTFALTCFSIGFYDIFCAGLYNTTSSVDGVNWQRAQIFALALASASFIWFVADYTKQTSKRWVVTLSACYFVIGVFQLIEHSEFAWSSQPAVKKISLLFGIQVTYFEMAPGPLINIGSLCGFLIFGYSLWASIRLYRSGDQRKAIPLFAVIIVFFIGVFNDSAVVSGLFQFVYLIEYAFLALVFFMAYALSTEVVRSLEYQEALHKSEERYRFITENVADVIYTMDLKFHFTYISPSIYQQRGFTVDEAMGLSLKEKILPDSRELIKKRHNEKLRLIKAGDPRGWKPSIFEIEQYCKDGTTIWTSNNSRILPGPDKQPASVLGITRDITSRKKAEDELKKAHDELEQKVVERTRELQQEIDERKQIEHDLLESRKEAEFANNAKSEFLSNVSHEFRTPMHQILSYSKFGVDKINEVKKEKLLHYFSKIGTIGKNLLVLLNNLLDLSKLESGKVDYDMKMTHPQNIISNTIDEFHSLIDEKGIILEKSISSSLSAIVCDEIKIGQVVRNLISNAIKFTPSGKKVSILVKPGELPINDKKLVPTALVAVIDQGVGIPEDELETVFDKFVQSSKTKTNAGGTGLGLAICKEIIKAHNGKIWAENNPEGGATFSFMLPYDQVES